MLIGVPKEIKIGEFRVAMSPAALKCCAGTVTAF